MGNRSKSGVVFSLGGVGGGSTSMIGVDVGVGHAMVPGSTANSSHVGCLAYSVS